MIRLLLPALLAVSSVAGAGGGGGAVPVGPGAPEKCAGGYVRPDFARLGADLNAARARWKAAGIRDYRYDFARVAAPVRFPDVRVTVAGGRIGDIAPQNPLEQISTTGLNVGPVEALFSEISRAIAYQRAQPCADLRVTYDPKDGHPLTFYSGSRLSPYADGYAEWRVTRLSARP